MYNRTWTKPWQRHLENCVLAYLSPNRQRDPLRVLCFEEKTMAVAERHFFFCGMESETSTAPRIVSVSQPSWNMTEPRNTFTLQQHTRTQSYKSTQSKSGQYFSPLKLWQRFPAVKSLLVHRAPPSWSLFNDAGTQCIVGLRCSSGQWLRPNSHTTLLKSMAE